MLRSQTRFAGWSAALLGFTALALTSAACGSDDSSLEDLGDVVQGTAAALATIETEHATTTPQPTATPEPEVVAELRMLRQHSRDLRTFFEFLDVRLGDPGTPALGSLGDESGNLASDWLDDCCERQWQTGNEALAAAAESVSNIQSYYESEEPSEEHLSFVSPIQAQVEELRSIGVALPAAATVADARAQAASGLASLDLLDGAIDALTTCCGAATVTPTQSATD